MYDSEEEQVEALKRWWKENSTATIVGLVMGIVIILGWNYWQDHKKAQSAQASATYDQLLKALDDDSKDGGGRAPTVGALGDARAVAENKNDSVDKLAQRMQEQFKGTEYAAFSGLFQAKLKAQQGDFAAAKQILKTIAAEPNKQLSNIAKIRLVRLMLATGEYEQGLQVINEVDAKAAASYSANYDELVGDLYVALDRLDEARTSYQNALRNGQPSPLLQFKIDDLTAQEKLETQK
ncbi:putative negative regulator of RcsB-dependent stress response [Methylobacter tundripaludum]|uniref:Putative negative regulator of RcsB-dependent stress response n=1 Tax=Methylobacter tundripaludum TaxID=173365 RepID=A0A2S6HEC1_9GAMM|nr:tetratricopeptide repeat protein [Methylobacter tundripaludum]PPK75825.1 putative negative regulator of RcsB-dependent stress response [Methylobacter tundripaludum]